MDTHGLRRDVTEEAVHRVISINFHGYQYYSLNGLISEQEGCTSLALVKRTYDTRIKWILNKKVGDAVIPRARLTWQAGFAQPNCKFLYKSRIAKFYTSFFWRATWRGAISPGFVLLPTTGLSWGGRGIRKDLFIRRAVGQAPPEVMQSPSSEGWKFDWKSHGWSGLALVTELLQCLCEVPAIPTEWRQQKQRRHCRQQAVHHQLLAQQLTAVEAARGRKEGSTPPRATPACEHSYCLCG